MTGHPPICEPCGSVARENVDLTFPLFFVCGGWVAASHLRQQHFDKSLWLQPGDVVSAVERVRRPLRINPEAVEELQEGTPLPTMSAKEDFAWYFAPTSGEFNRLKERTYRVRTAAWIRAGRGNACQSVCRCVGGEHVPEPLCCERPARVARIWNICVRVNKGSQSVRLRVSSAGHDHAPIGMPDQDDILAQRAYGLNGCIDVCCEVGRWRRRIAESRQSQRLGVMTAGPQLRGDTVEHPTALPSTRNQNKSRHLNLFRSFTQCFGYVPT